VLDANEAEIIEAMRAGFGYRAIAPKYDVSIGLLAQWVAANPERSHACARAREESADQCDEEAEDLLRDAADPFELAKARELAVHLRWRAKSRNPKVYGDKIQQEHSGEIGLLGLAERMRKQAGEQ
jgi:hypothetical protein